MSSFCWQWETVSFIRATKSILSTDGQVISITSENLRTSAASSQYAKALSLGEKLCASIFLFSLFFYASSLKKKKTGGEYKVVSGL